MRTDSQRLHRETRAKLDLLESDFNDFLARNFGAARKRYFRRRARLGELFGCDFTGDEEALI